MLRHHIPLLTELEVPGGLGYKHLAPHGATEQLFAYLELTLLIFKSITRGMYEPRPFYCAAGQEDSA